ncbi:hypothetical protein [Erwinia sp. 198]|uniref:hypothetical protein n=1 Tax=Erwinia sp. 198 TaxID=2022746 RepID=UPI000F679212|nr:hypothetical protein [Erwinia sp. 198]RRZ96731.1 hypothetical protein EGK14_00030 [Erwinia sp. 198]
MERFVNNRKRTESWPNIAHQTEAKAARLVTNGAKCFLKFKRCEQKRDYCCGKRQAASGKQEAGSSEWVAGEARKQKRETEVEGRRRQQAEEASRKQAKKTSRYGLVHKRKTPQ